MTNCDLKLIQRQCDQLSGGSDGCCQLQKLQSIIMAGEETLFLKKSILTIILKDFSASETSFLVHMNSSHILF